MTDSLEVYYDNDRAKQVSRREVSTIKAQTVPRSITLPNDDDDEEDNDGRVHMNQCPWCVL